MKSIFVTSLSLLSLFFVFAFNVLGQNWDMSGYNPQLDTPASEPFMPPTTFSPARNPSLYLEGQDIVLSTTTYGGGLSYEWFYQDQLIKRAQDNILVIFGAQQQSSGQYKIKVKNTLGSTEHIFEVRILPKDYTEDPDYKAPRIIHHSGNGSAVIGRPYSISVTATGKPSTYRWYKNGQLVVNASSQRLLFRKFKRTDAALYKVEVINENGIDVQKIFIHADRDSDSRENS